MYNAITLVNKIRSGEITLDNSGHTFYGSHENQLQSLIDTILWMLDHHTKALEEKTAEASTLDYHCRSLDSLNSDQFVQIGKPIITLLGERIVCHHCGIRIDYYLKSPTVIGVGEINWKDLTATDIVCIYPDGNIPPHTTKINLPTGRLLFANFFKEFEDAPEAEQYSEKWTMNSTKGRINRADHLAEQGAGYCQTGNMSVHFFKHKSRDEIIVLNSNSDDTEEYLEEIKECAPEETEKIAELEGVLVLLQDYDFIGQISCGMWRWMCADVATLRERSMKGMEYMDYVYTKVKAGTWEITDYFYDDDNQRSLIATLKLAN